MRASNLLNKSRRLAAKLVAFGDAQSLDKQKKYFQFRLVGVDDIDTDLKKALDNQVGKAVVDTLCQDATKELAALEEAQKGLPDKLDGEINHLATLALALLPKDHEGNIVRSQCNDQQRAVYDLWANTKTYNLRWFAEQVIKLQAGLDNKVCPDSRVLTICFDICNVVLTEIYRLIALADCVDKTTSLYVSTISQSN